MYIQVEKNGLNNNGLLFPAVGGISFFCQVHRHVIAIIYFQNTLCITALNGVHNTNYPQFKIMVSVYILLLILFEWSKKEHLDCHTIIVADFVFNMPFRFLAILASTTGPINSRQGNGVCFIGATRFFFTIIGLEYFLSQGMHKHRKLSCYYL